jgi:hypothetical protein
MKRDKETRAELGNLGAFYLWLAGRNSSGLDYDQKILHILWDPHIKFY